MALTVFDPVDFSDSENLFLADNLGKPPQVALRLVPAGVNPAAVEPMLRTVYDLVEFERHTGSKWAGVEALRESISVYLDQMQKWASDKRRNRPRFPSMSAYDTKNRPHYGGPGSDSGKIKTYFDASGNRVRFAVDLIPDGNIDWTPDWAEGQAVDAQPQSAGLAVNATDNRIECKVCGHTESFRPESRGSFNAARGRMSKHLRNDPRKQYEQAHRETHSLEFN